MVTDTVAEMGFPAAKVDAGVTVALASAFLCAETWSRDGKGGGTGCFNVLGTSRGLLGRGRRTTPVETLREWVRGGGKMMSSGEFADAWTGIGVRELPRVWDCVRRLAVDVEADGAAPAAREEALEDSPATEGSRGSSGGLWGGEAELGASRDVDAVNELGGNGTSPAVGFSVLQLCGYTREACRGSGGS